jgi:hypothetical protein
MFKLAIPVLHVGDSVAATEFYCERLGFKVRSLHTGLLAALILAPRDLRAMKLAFICLHFWRMESLAA